GARGRQQRAGGAAGGDVAGRAMGQAALEDRSAQLADLLAQAALLHGHYSSCASALAKKFTSPKLPDLRASAIGCASRLSVHGTPGSIWGPMRSARMPSAPTTAPAVSPA